MFLPDAHSRYHLLIRMVQHEEFVDRLAAFGNLLIQKFGIGVVDDTLQQFAESGKFLVVQAVEHMNVASMGLDGLGRGTVPRLAASTFRTCVVARATVRARVVLSLVWMSRMLSLWISSMICLRWSTMTSPFI